MVLKFICDCGESCQGYVSVPLRGYGFEIIPNRHKGRRLSKVSVPLRGYGFEMLENATKRPDSRRFRPLAGFLLLSFPRRYGGSGEQREPMGALVACVHF